MYTRCPECHTTLRISAADLQQAGGRVRCGRCNSTFDALASLLAEHDLESSDPIETETSLDLPRLQPEEEACPNGDKMDIDEAPAGVAALEQPRMAQRPRRLARWIEALLAAGLCLALVAQMVHQYRESLAAHPVSADWVAGLYETIGQPLYPAWPLADYHLRARDDAALSLTRELEIVATLSNRGAWPLPPPLIRLTLLDRWGAPMGSRVFTPQDYLAGRTPARMAPGQQLQATLAVRAPEGELYGYRLDICRPLDVDTLRCDAQAR